MKDVLKEGVVLSPDEDDITLKILDENDLATLRRLWYEAKSLHEVLSEDEDLAAMWEEEGNQLAGTLEEAREFLWDK
jgi:hypothetical protein